MHIREIRNSQYFQDLCQQLLAAEYTDFQVIDDSGGDAGNDGYVPSLRRLYAIYCPEDHPTLREYYQRKIRSDVRKAARLRDEKGYLIDEWVFVTPAALHEELHRYISEKMEKAGFKKGISWSEKQLVNLLAKHLHLRPQFVDLVLPDLENGIRTVIGTQEVHHEEVLNHLSEIKLLVTPNEGANKQLKGRLAQEYSRRLDEAKEKSESGLYLTSTRLCQGVLRDLKKTRRLMNRYCSSALIHIWRRMRGTLITCRKRRDFLRKPIRTCQMTSAASLTLPAHRCYEVILRQLCGRLRQP